MTTLSAGCPAGELGQHHLGDGIEVGGRAIAGVGKQLVGGWLPSGRSGSTRLMRVPVDSIHGCSPWYENPISADSACQPPVAGTLSVFLRR